MYYNLGTYKVAQVLRSKKIVKESFEPELIGLTASEYQTFLAATF